MARGLLNKKPLGQAKSKSNKTLLLFKCTTEKCNHLLRVPPSKIQNYTGFCTSCLKKKKPYGVLFKKLLSDCKKRKIECELTHEDFMSLIFDSKCHYCESNLIWKAHLTSKENSKGYNLDRKNNSLGYTLQNCVTCCGVCNKAKNNIFTYEEFLKIGNVIKNILAERKTHV